MTTDLPAAEPSPPSPTETPAAAPSEAAAASPAATNAPPELHADAILAALHGGPLTSHGLATAFHAHSTQFEEREGLLFPLLVELARRGLVVSRWVDAGPVRRRVHRLAGAAEPACAPAPGALWQPGERLVRAATAATKRIAFAGRVRDELHAEILHHLQDAAATLASGEGLAPGAAERRAADRLGDSWKVSVDLRRAIRGQPIVAFPRGLGEQLRSIAIYDLRVLVVILAAIVLIRVEVVTAYHIPTKSMEPTLHGDPKHGDRILVNKLTSEPSRFDIFVFDGWGSDRKNFVKRCVALPGEKIELHEGDVWIDDHLVRKDGAAYEALLFEVFDQERERARAEKRPGEGGAESAFRERMGELWKAGGGGEVAIQTEVAATFAGFRLAAKDGEDPPQLAWHAPVDDSYVDPESGETSPGAWSDPDMRVTARVQPIAGTHAQVALRLTRGSSHDYDAILDADTRRVCLVVDGDEVAHADGAGVAEGAATEVSFAQVDRVLRLVVGGKLVLRHEMPEPEFPQREAPAGLPMLRVARGAAWIDPVRLERDVYYNSECNADFMRQLGPDEFFMLGDNSKNSSDSRVNGPVHRGRLVGAPLLVVWPPSRFHVPR